MPADRVARRVADLDLGQVGLAMNGVYFAPKADVDIGFCAQLFDQIVGHALLKGLAAHQQRHRPRMA